MTKYIFQKNEETFGYNFLNIDSPITIPEDEEIQFYYTVGDLTEKKWLDMLLWGIRDYTAKGVKLDCVISRTSLTGISFTLSFKVKLLDKTITNLGYIEIIDPRGEAAHNISFTKA